MSKKKNSLLWQISAPDNQAQSYILGTMHVRDKRAFRLVERSLPYLNRCSLFCAEYDLSSGHSPSEELLRRIQSVPPLLDLLGIRNYEKLRKVLLQRIGLNLDFYNTIHPMMLLSMIQQKVLGTEEVIILDAFLWDYAGENQIERKGIETIDSQMLTLLELPIRWNIDTLKSISRNFKKFRKKTEKLLQYYETEHLTAIHRASRKMDGEAKRILATRRNIQMANFMANEARNKPAFFAIGAAHLSGEKGVLRMLKKKGFRLRPIHS